MKTITLVGYGQIGSRHLEALVKINDMLLVQVVSRSKTAIELSKERVNEVLKDKRNITVEWHSSFDGLNVSDLCIIATMATNRVEILLNLLDRGNKKFLIEKLVCQSDSDYSNLLNKFKNENAKGWVNCNRRYNPFYRNLRDELNNSKYIIMKVTGGNYGLGSNAIHFLDLFGYFAHSTTIELDGSFLDEKIYKNRRSNDMVEFCGTLVGRNENGDFLDITFADVPKGNCIVSVSGEHISCFVDEEKGKAQVALETKGWEWYECDFNNLFVSQITTEIATEIIDENNCSLASLEESYNYHRSLLSVFNRHISKLTGTSSNICPIT